MDSQHIGLCPKFPLVCPNKCKPEIILRGDMETHRKECPLEVVQCGYHNVGCKIMLNREDLQKHNQEKMEEHLSLTMSELVITKIKLAATEQQMMRCIRWALHLNSTASNSTDQIFPVIIKMAEFERKKRSNDDWYSHTFFTHEEGYNMKLNVLPAGSADGLCTHVSVYLYMAKGPHDDELRWPMKKRLKVKLLNQISDTQHHSEVHTVSTKKSATQGNKWIWYAHKFISYDLLFFPTADCNYLDNNSIFFEVSEEL